MSVASLTQLGANRFAVTGSLDFDTVTALLQQSADLFGSTPSIDIDLTNVTDADSAGLALLLEWLRYGKQHNKNVRYLNLPAQLKSLAAISEVDGLLQPVS